MNSTRFLVITGLILAAAVWRIIPHEWNFAPVGALALFAGACLRPRWAALLVPVTAMALSDLMIYYTRGHPADPVVYLTFVLIVGIGFWLQSRRTVLPIAGAALASSVLFFLVTNFAVWLTGGGLPRENANTLTGLLLCYADAIPFFRGTFLGDALFTALLFGGFAVLEYYLPALRERVRPAAEPVAAGPPVPEGECVAADR